MPIDNCSNISTSNGDNSCGSFCFRFVVVVVVFGVSVFHVVFVAVCVYVSSIGKKTSSQEKKILISKSFNKDELYAHIHIVMHI